jgi:hypothetical protein
MANVHIGIPMSNCLSHGAGVGYSLGSTSMALDIIIGSRLDKMTKIQVTLWFGILQKSEGVQS